MPREIDFNFQSKMTKGYPKIRKNGAISPAGESSPFVWHGELYRLELIDASRGTDPSEITVARIIKRDTGEILSRFGEGCYYHSLYQEGDTVYVLGTVSKPGMLCGEEIRLFETRDLVNWTSRSLLKNPGWQYFNTSLTKGENGYVLLMEANQPVEHVGKNAFTFFFATSPDLVNWEFMSYDKGFSKDRYMGGPYMRYSRGYYYVFSVTALPCCRYTNYVYRTKDFDTWQVGTYNPVMMPGEDDRAISVYAADLSDELIREIRTGFISNNSDMDMCEYNGKTIITYGVGNQLGFYYLAEAEYDGPVADFLEAFFEDEI